MKLQIKKVHRLISALCVNVLIIILEIIALILSLIEHGLENFFFLHSGQQLSCNGCKRFLLCICDERTTRKE